MAAAPSPALSHAGFTGTRVFGSLDGLRCLSIAAVVWGAALSIGSRRSPADHLIAMDLSFRAVGKSHANWLLFSACLLVSVAIAEVSYRMFESRFLRLKPRFAAGAVQ